jgi:hypothetical protein
MTISQKYYRIIPGQHHCDSWEIGLSTPSLSNLHCGTLAVEIISIREDILGRHKNQKTTVVFS